MSRPKRIRRMNNPPHFKGFRPIGMTEDHPVVINYEEYEAIRLSDFELFGQVEAAQAMGVSRPTFARIYESARRKVAKAFVQGNPLFLREVRFILTVSGIPATFVVAGLTIRQKTKSFRMPTLWFFRYRTIYRGFPTYRINRKRKLES